MQFRNEVERRGEYNSFEEKIQNGELAKKMQKQFARLLICLMIFIVIIMNQVIFEDLRFEVEEKVRRQKEEADIQCYNQTKKTLSGAP